MGVNARHNSFVTFLTIKPVINNPAPEKPVIKIVIDKIKDFFEKRILFL